MYRRFSKKNYFATRTKKGVIIVGKTNKSAARRIDTNVIIKIIYTNINKYGADMKKYMIFVNLFICSITLISISIVVPCFHLTCSANQAFHRE